MSVSQLDQDVLDACLLVGQTVREISLRSMRSDPSVRGALYRLASLQLVEALELQSSPRSRPITMWRRTE